jgi:hypothetical protein
MIESQDNLLNKQPVQQLANNIAADIEKVMQSRERELQEQIDGLQMQITAISATKELELTDKSLFLNRYRESLAYHEKNLPANLKEGLKEKSEDFKESMYSLTGGWYFNYTDSDREYFVRAARDKEKFSPFIRNGINIIKAAVMSGAFKIDIPHEFVDSEVEKVLRKNNFTEKLRRWVAPTFVDGEKFLVMFIRDSGIKIREVDPLEITEFNYHRDDPETILAYKREYQDTKGELREQWYRDAYYDEFLDDDSLEKDELGETGNDKDLMFWFHYGNRLGERGEMPLLPALRWDRIIEDINLDLARLYHERAKVVWILRFIGSDKTFSRTESPVRGSTIKIETDNKRWRIENPRLSEHTSKEYGAPHRSALAASFGLGNHLIFADVSGSSYASLRKSDMLTFLTISSHRNFWSDNIQRLVRVLIREMVKTGALPRTVQIETLPAQDIQTITTEAMAIANMVGHEQSRIGEGMKLLEGVQNKYSDLKEAKKLQKKQFRVNTVDLPINIILPRQESDNPLLFAQALNVLRVSGVLSARTAMKMLGLEPDIEQALIQMEMLVADEDPSTATKTTKKKVVSKGGKTEQPQTNQDRKLDRGNA